METSIKKYKNCDLVTLSGRVDSSTAPDLTKILDSLTGDSRYKIILDMSDLEYMSSAGFRTLLSSQRECKRFNRGEILLASVPQIVKEALDLTGFDELFEIFDNGADAVNSF